MKKILIYIIVLYASCYAYAEPMVGVYANLPVYNYPAGVMKPVASEMLIFTAKRLDRAATFSVFQSQEKGTFNVACCFDVVDINAISTDKLLKKYYFDISFSELLKGIKGYQYAYNVRYSKQAGNKWQKILMQSYGLESSIPYLMPAAEIKILFDDLVKNPISTEPFKIELSEKYIRGNVNRESYHFSVDGQKINFSVPLQTGE